MRRNSEEAKNQEALFQWISLHSGLSNFIFHIPNGGYRNKNEAYSLKRQGVMSGVCDIFVALPNEKYHGLWIEMKSRLGRVSPNQKYFGDNMKSVGYDTIVCRSWMSAKSAIEIYLSTSKYSELLGNEHRKVTAKRVCN